MMEENTGIAVSFSKLNLKSKIDAVECTLNETIRNFKDLVSECERVQIESDSLRSHITEQTEKCERKCCLGSEELKKVIQSKDNIIQLAASAITKLNETKNFNIITEVFKILFGDTSVLEIDKKECMYDDDISKTIKTDCMSDNNDVQMMIISPKVEPMSHDESLSEIESTPTGRHSPIFQTKSTRNSTPNRTDVDKKKCPDNWLTPGTKTLKLTYPTPTKTKGGGRLRQQRLTLVKEKKTNVVDLTCLPQFQGGRSQSEDCIINNIKQEVMDNDDTILPSPTSGPIFPPMFKSITKDSPQKFKRPLSLKRAKEKNRVEEGNEENKPLDDITNVPEFDQSVNLLEQYQNGFLSPKKLDPEKKAPIHADDSISLLQHVNMLDNNNMNQEFCSPPKSPLAENVNHDNGCNIDCSLSILRKNIKLLKNVASDNKYECRKTKPDVQEPLYKEPTVRKKAEKRALPGWSCDECKNFYAELYADNPAMLAKKMEECSKHRGRTNPQRPKTPPGYWYPRWDVPDDTEEFNRRNNAV